MAWVENFGALTSDHLRLPAAREEPSDWLESKRRSSLLKWLSARSIDVVFLESIRKHSAKNFQSPLEKTETSPTLSTRDEPYQLGCRMNRKHLFTASLLIAWSGGCFASTAASKGVITFQGGIINAPCVANGGVDGILLSECPDITTGKSAPGMNPVLMVSSLDHSARQGTLIATKRESNKTDTLHYVISDSKGSLVSQGKYLIVLKFP